MSFARQSIKTLYPLALAEGEGVGTAYEYVAKWQVLRRWWQNRPSPQSLLIAGLPEKYGAGLDWLWLAHAWGIRPIIVDERPQALAHLDASLRAAQAAGLLSDVQYTGLTVAQLTDIDAPIDLAVSTEVVQRLAAEMRPQYVQTLLRLAPAIALFAPNGDNPAHTTISGLNGITLAEWRRLLPTSGTWRAGYVDLPPFPPGITRSAEQRVQARRGRLEALAMWGLGYFARLERGLPRALTRRAAHIVYALGRR